MPDILLDALAAMDAKATKGPWEIAPYPAGSRPINVVSEFEDQGPNRKVANWIAEFDLQDEEREDEDAGNAAILIRFRNALPALLAYVRAADALRGNAGNMIRAHAAQEVYDAARAELARGIEGMA